MELDHAAKLDGLVNAVLGMTMTTSLDEIFLGKMVFRNFVVDMN